MTREVLLEGMALGKRYAGRRGVGFLRRGDPLDAVHEVSLRLHLGETLGLVGESGSGKSTCARLLLRLEAPTRGRVAFRGRDLSDLTSVELRDFRRSAQIVFQDPFASLNPRLTIGGMLREVLRVHGLARGAGIDRRVTELLELVGLEAGDAGRYPHEFSGGQRQRVGIARALSVEPEVVVADEPVSALDLSVQAQILNLLAELQERLGLSYLLIAHDLAVVRHMCDRVAVMFQGRIVEEGPTESLYSAPRHPYTRDLLASVPGTERRGRGEAPYGARKAGPARLPAAAPGQGCPFYPRCRQPNRDEACLADVPTLEAKAPDHRARCVKT